MQLSDRVQRRTRTFRKEELARSTTIDAPLPSAAVHLDIPAPAHGLKVAVVTDAQVKDGVPLEHLAAAGKYIAEKRPDVVVCIGDFADMASMSAWDVPGSLKAENRRYKKDTAAVQRGMELLMEPIVKEPGYDPHLVMTLGNHEDRIPRYLNKYPILDGVVSQADLGYEQWGWTIFPFLQPVVIGGVAFCHYFPNGVMGRPITSPSMLLKHLHMTAFAGHQQGRQIAYGKRADGQDMTAIISGSFYQHHEDYLSPFTNKHWRGMYFLHEVKDGAFDEMALSVGYLLRRYK